MALVKKLTKIGNSTGVILPTEVLKIAGLNNESEVEISAENHQIILKPIHLEDHRIFKTFMGVLKDYDETFKKLAK